MCTAHHATKLHGSMSSLEGAEGFYAKLSLAAILIADQVLLCLR